MTNSSVQKNKLTSLQTEHSSVLTEIAKYKLLVDSVQDYAIFLLDQDGYVQTWNKGAEKIKGYKPEEIIGKHFSSFYIPRDIKDNKPARELEIAQKVGRTEDEDWRVRKDGTRFWANVVITALFEDGELVGFAKVTRDLTERKQQEDALRKANVILKQQQKELQELNNSKDEFISLASHQLRTPATAIKQLLGLVLEGLYGEVSDQILPIVKKSYDSNQRQINIINSLLKVAQVDAGKVVLNKSPVILDELIEDVISEQQENIAAHEQTVSFTPSAAETVILADPQYLRMALENILDNASKYSFTGTAIDIKTEVTPTSVTIAITDKGVGISPENIGTLFDKFNRIPNDLSQTVPGTGLGLYWMKKIIDLHDGTIDVESRLGEGTTFKISLPREEAYA